MQQEADVLIRLEHEIRNQTGDVTAKAEEEAKAIRARAEKEASSIAEELRANVRGRLTQLRQRRTQQAALQARQQVGRVKADAVSESIRLAGAQLTGEQFKSQYKTALASLLSEALERLKPSKGPFRIIVRREDESRVKELAAAQGIQASVDSSAAFSGGIEVVDDKARMRVVNTFESRLRQGFDVINERVRKILHV